jgi:NADPH:quinone reductase-like Zn-dependent oxidoreductase
MKAIVRTRYGSPDELQFTEVTTPSPAANEVLIKLCAASVNPVDLFVLQGAPWNRIPGLRSKPKRTIIGCDIAGRVEAVGENVKQLQAGDEVFGITGLDGNGFAEYVCAPEERLALKPANLSFESAAAVPIAAITALQGLRDIGKIQPGNKVLIEGASGGVGTFAVQIAKELGAEITGVCSTRNLDLARSLGANHVIDYSKADFARLGQRYDLIMAVNGHHSIFEYRRMLTQNGIYVAVGALVPVLQALLLGRLLSTLGRKKMTFFIAKINHSDLAFLQGLLQAGKIAPVIDRRYPLSDAAEALRYLGEGHAQGKVVLTVAP